MRLVVKVGGSLTRDREGLIALLDDLAATAADHYVLVVPGGGEIADVIRTLDARFGLRVDTSHHMALLAMESMGRLLAELMGVGIEGRAEELQREGTGLRVLSITELAPALGIPVGWHVTSDAIALYVAEFVGADRVILAKDVGSVYDTDPKAARGAVPLETINASELPRLPTSPVDDHFPEAALSLGRGAFLIKGDGGGVIQSVAAGRPFPGTRIIPA